MTLTQTEAEAALRDVKSAEQRSALLRGYQSASPHLMIWGVVWAIGYTIDYVAPAWQNRGWIALIVLGTTAGIFASRADRSGERANVGWKFFGIFISIFLFISGSMAVMAPTDPRQVGAFIPMIVAVIYATIGVLGAPRMIFAGGAIWALTLIGYFELPAIFSLWMAGVGGGALILGGLWLRRA